MSKLQDAKRKQFYGQLKAVIKPELVRAGFDSDGDRVFRRLVPKDDLPVIQIIEFQVGVKRLIGKYTANVGVFSNRFLPENWHVVSGAPVPLDCLPAMRERLGYFFDPPRSLTDSLLGRSKQPRHDYWWDQFADEEKMAKGLRSVLLCLQQEVLPWLDSLSCRDAFERALRELERAKKRKESQGSGVSIEQ